MPKFPDIPISSNVNGTISTVVGSDSPSQAIGNVIPSIPKVVTDIGNSIGEGAAKAQNYITSNFKLPNLSQKAAELGDKLLKTGTATLFGKAVVKPGAIDKAVSSALGDAVNAQQEGGIPADVLSLSQKSTNERKVIITQYPEVGGDINRLVLNVMPRIDERGGADYEAIQPLHHPGVIQKYRGSTARSWSISGRLISRNVGEATENLKIINMIRSWRMPFYGAGTAADSSLNQYLGAPPPVLKLEAYGEGAIGPVMCVMKDYSWSWDNTLDYIPTVDGVAFPVLLDISLSLEESWSPAEYSNFDLQAYKQGRMLGGAFSTGANLRDQNQEPPVPESMTAETTAATTQNDRSEPAQGNPTPPVPTDVYHGATFGQGGATASEEAGSNTLTF